ncbi:MAG: rod shape-determining protein RodA [Eggerthellaceae bacterium]|nr:rod shape-determining protein RodA [Eggerthellaceae bacterium]
MAQVPEISAVGIRSRDGHAAPKLRRGFLGFINFPLLATVALLVGYGLVVVWSAVVFDEDYSFTRQLTGVAVGAVVMMALCFFDYRKLSSFTTVFLVINVLLILSPRFPVIGVSALGAARWISIFGFQIQPGEVAKITVILLAASTVARYGGKLDDLRQYLKTLGILAVPFACIVLQPDLGTGLVYLFIAAVALVVGGARPKYLLMTVVAVVAFAGVMFVFDEVIKGVFGDYKLIKNYQRERLLVFMDQSYNQSDEGYNLNQAKIAIGSGGLFGKGLLNGTQSTLGFLPEAPTDFIFCVLAEQLGFLGVLALFGLYSLLVLICFRIAGGAQDLFGILIVMCIVGMWLFHILENIGMTCGLLPISGIPLPFMSYGSSFMILNFVLLGLIGSVWAHGSR